MKNISYLLLLVLLFSCSDDPADTMDPAVINTDIIPNVGVGDISFEDDGNAIKAIHGDYDNINAISSPEGVQFAIWYDSGLAFQLSHIDVGNLTLAEIVAQADDLVDLNQTITTMIIRAPFSGQTAEGIKLGSNRDAVVLAYGEPDNIGSLSEDYDDLNASLQYSSADNTLTRIDMRK